EIIPKKLLTIEGVGAGKACLIAAALELGRRFNSSPAATVHSPVDVLPLIKHYTLEKQEHFLCASLNGAHEILSIRTVSVGTLNRCVIHPREVYAEAIKERAAAIILAHNHPSGNPEPSQNDIETTQQLYDAAKILGIHLLDHVIITTHDYFSFAENSLVFSS
ncbi:MAG: DNA repair protein RadC, partial [Spirochaetales bacterium]